MINDSGTNSNGLKLHFPLKVPGESKTGTFLNKKSQFWFMAPQTGRCWAVGGIVIVIINAFAAVRVERGISASRLKKRYKFVE
jgi:hypothetical protein